MKAIIFLIHLSVGYFSNISLRQQKQCVHPNLSGCSVNSVCSVFYVQQGREMYISVLPPSLCNCRGWNYRCINEIYVCANPDVLCSLFVFDLMSCLYIKCHKIMRNVNVKFPQPQGSSE